MSRSVLVVDDVAFVRKTLAAILTENGFEVVGEAANGVDAVEQYSRLRPSLVTMDIVMPKMSGLQALEQAKADPRIAGIPIFILTNSSMPLDMAKANDLGVEGFFVKSNISLSDLVAKVKESLGGV